MAEQGLQALCVKHHYRPPVAFMTTTSLFQLYFTHRLVSFTYLYFYLFVYYSSVVSFYSVYLCTISL